MDAMPSSSVDPAVPRPRSSARWVLLLGALATLPALTVDMYLPLLPEVGAELGAPDSLAQLTLSAMLVGGAVGQLVIGPLSDRYGRRLPVLVGLSLHVVTSILCAMAPNIGILIGLRVLQGFFNASASVVAIAAIRDRFTGSDADAVKNPCSTRSPMRMPMLGASAHRSEVTTCSESPTSTGSRRP